MKDILTGLLGIAFVIFVIWAVWSIISTSFWLFLICLIGGGVYAVSQIFGNAPRF